MKNEFPNLIHCLEQGMKVSLATIITSTGSPPHKTGSSAIFGPDGLLYGTIGGSLIDTEAGFLAAESGQTSNIYTFSHQSGEDLSINRQITVLLDSNPQLSLDVFRKMKSSLDKGHGGVLLTLISDNQKILVERYWIDSIRFYGLPLLIREVAAESITEMLDTGPSSDCRLIKLSDEEDIFLETVHP